MLSWLLELFLSNVPSWLWLAGAGSGLTLYLLSSVLAHIPEIETWGKLIKPVAGIATLLCVFMYGGAGVQAMWEEKVRLAQEEADRKAAMATQLNEDLAKERKKKAEVRTEYRDRIQTQIKEVEKVIDAKCEIDPKVPELLNKAATNPEKAQ
jgi:hypothetical protein